MDLEKILEAYRPLIISSIQRYANYPHLFEDLYQDGVVEIISALNDYDEDTGVSLGWFLKVRLRTFFINKQKYERRRMALPLESADKKAGNDPFEGHLNRAFVNKLMVGLSSEERDVIRFRYFDNLSAKETAGALGFNPQRVYYLERTALNRMRSAADLC